MTDKTIHIYRVSEDPHTGKRRWKIKARDVDLLMSWEGFDLNSVRGSRGIRKDGSVHFTTGGGYAIFDADLLGGNGDGTAERRAERDGFAFRIA